MTLNVSINGLPLIDRAGLYPGLNAVPEFTHRNPSSVLHLYDYEVVVRIGEADYRVQKGDLTCIPAGTVYSFSTNSPGDHWCIHFYDTPTEKAEAISLPEHFRLGTHSLHIREQMQNISRLVSRPTQMNLIHLEARFRLKALLLALHNLSEGDGTGRRRQAPLSWDELLGWIDAHLDRPITASMLGERVNLSAPTFSKRFRQAHETTLSRYLLDRRIEKARALLATTALTIFEVGSSVGISDPQYFNKQFRRISGISPTRYREQNQYFQGKTADEPATHDGKRAVAPGPMHGKT